jgi:ankyrin repeat protein
MCQRLKIVPVDHFHVGLDGNGSCALHTAAFNGACRVLEFLVQGVDPYGRDDGGLADVNIRDSNNWTAMHFCAGANSVDSVRILASNGAQLALEANNGYTPFHWAQRLSNHEVANELQRLGGDQRFLLRSFLGL